MGIKKFSLAQAAKASGSWLHKNRGCILTMCLALTVLSVMSVNGMLADGGGIFDRARSIVGTLATELKNIYCYRLAPLFLIIDLIIIAVSKDDKLVGGAKRALVYIAIAWIAIMSLDAILTTLKDLAAGDDGGDDSWSFGE